MRKVIFIALLVKCIYCEIISDDLFTIRKEEVLPLPIMIGGYPYNFSKIVDNVLVFQSVPYSMKFQNLPYPLEYDLPKVVFPNNDIIKKSLDKNENKKPIQELSSILEERINELTKGLLLPIFKLNYALSIRPSNHFDMQVLFTWNSKMTFMILNYPKNELIFDINLGKGINRYNISRDFPETQKTQGRQIYEISTSRMIRIGCQPDKGKEQNRNNLEISMSKYRLSGLGNEQVVLQAICFNELVIENAVELKIKNSDNIEVASIKMGYSNKDNLFNFTTPILWYPGIYEFSFSFKSLDFLSKVEIYTPESTFENYKLQWNESDQMNNPNYNLNHITLLLPSFVHNYNFLTFYIIDLVESDKNKKAVIFSKEITINKKDDKTYLEIEIKDLCIGRIISSQQLGFISMTDINNKKEWTRPFSLVWMKYCNNSTSDEECLNHLSKPAKQKTYSCPENSNMALGLLSTFRKIDFDIDLVKDNMDKYTCFSQILPDSDNRGVTCCYFNENKFLIYGQDFQLRNNSYLGSYTWTFSPFQKPLNHFLNDRLPILACCTFINNNTLCANYWNKFHNIKIIRSESDHRANIFGDPHFIPYKSSSKFTFLGLGQYNLITTNDNKFILQGRFHYINKGLQSSLLKAIVFNFSNGNVVVTPSSNDLTDLKWKILFNSITEQIFSLPFRNENLFIFQNDDGTKLQIFIYFPEQFYVNIELERFAYDSGLLEYINMKIGLSNNFEKILTGGLFGTIDKKETSTGLFKDDSREPLPLSSLQNYREMFEFAKTWKLTNKYPKLFFDMDYSEPDDTFLQPKFTLDAECENIVQCSIDKHFYNNDIYSETVAVFNSRLKSDSEWKSSFSVGFVCDHPPWQLIQLNSSNFMEDETIQILGCYNLSLIMSNKYQELTCKLNSNGKTEWSPNPPFQGEFCTGPSANKSKTGTIDPIILYSSVGGSVFVIILIIFLFLLIFLVRKKRKVPEKNPYDNSLTMTSTVDLNSIYDNIIRLNEDEYTCYYAQIQKDKKSDNV